jgi:hypothetical protein
MGQTERKFMKSRVFSVAAVCVVGLLFFGCSKSKSSENVNASAGDQEAIKAAITQHLNADSGINMSVMEMTVDSVTINGDQAQADAAFHVKNGPGAMHITYKLERRAGQWTVLTGAPAGMAPSHGAADGPQADAPGSPKSVPDMSDYMKKH